MIIEKVNMFHVKLELVSHFETSFGRSFFRHCVLLEVFSEGLVGWGECVADLEPGYASETVGTSWHILKDFILPEVVGKNLSGVHDFIAKVGRIRGHRMAKAGFEMALWDLQGKQERKSLRELIGGQKPAVKVGVSVGIQDSVEELLATVENYLDQGYGRVKIKIKPGRDVSDAEAVRKRYPELHLQVDANSAYDLETARSLAPLDNLGLLLIEQPLADDDLLDHSRLQAVFKTPICLDESIRSPRHARQALELQACRVINIKPGRVGGMIQARKIHDICLEQQVPVWCGGMLECGVGRAANLALASLPGFSLPGDISATERYYAQDITEQKFVLNPDSTITVPSGFGLGVDIDQSVLRRATQARMTVP